MGIMSSKDVVNVASSQPVKKHWLRHVMLVLLVTFLAIAGWLIISSMMHKAV